MTERSRRHFLKTIGMASAASLVTGTRWCGTESTMTVSGIPLPRPAQVTWQDCEVGLIYHFDLAIAASAFAPNNTVQKTLDPSLYNPHRLDTDQWLEAAKAAGAQYAVFTATHFNGFMQWQSDLYPYGLKQAQWRDGEGDVVADFVASCRKAGIKPCIYFSTHRNVYWTVWGHYVDWGRGRGTEKQAAFNRVAEKMTEELCSRYGPLLQIWYDAGVKTPAEGGPDVLPVFEKYQPESVFYHNRQRADHRWIGNEVGHAGYPCWATMPGAPGEQSHNSELWKPYLSSGEPMGESWSPGMVDVPLRGANSIHNWFWGPDQDHACHSTEKLVEMYYNSVGRNSNFIIGEVITPEGLVPNADIERLADFGKEIRRRFNTAIAETCCQGYALELSLEEPSIIDHVVIMEDIPLGERIRAYDVEGLTPDNQWGKLCDGQSVGHKRIQSFPAVEVAKVRLRVTEATADPILRRLAVYHV